MRNYIGEITFMDNHIKEGYGTESEYDTSFTIKNFNLLYTEEIIDLYTITLDDYFIIIDGELYSSTEGFSVKNESFIKQYIHLYKNDKESFINELNGSFNLIVYNFEKDELEILNDRFATRPLYFYYDERRFIFSNKMSSIPRYYPDNEWTINFDSVREFLNMQMVFGYKTHVNNIETLENASYKIISRKENVQRKYWQFKHKHIENFDEKNYIKELSNLIVKIMKEKTEENYRYGIYMSGGMDSRAVIAADQSDKINEIFTLGDSYNIECKVADLISKYKGHTFNYLERDFNYYYDIIDAATNASDGMYNYTNAHFIGYNHLVSQKVDVIFNGSLIEQLWQGTKFISPHVKIHNRYVGLPWLFDNKYSDETLSILRNSFPRQIPMGKEIFVNPELTDDIVMGSLKDRLLENFDSTEVPLQEAIDYLACDSYGRYSSHLNQLCINEQMKYRTVYDNRLIDKILEVPYEYRDGGKMLKKILKELDPDMLEIPVASSRLKMKRNSNVHWGAEKILLAKSFYKKSKSYKMENSSWPHYATLLRDNKNLQNRIEDIIEDKLLFPGETFDRQLIKKLYTSHIRGIENNERILFLLLSYGEWRKGMKNFIKNE